MLFHSNSWDKFKISCTKSRQSAGQLVVDILSLCLPFFHLPIITSVLFILHSSIFPFLPSPPLSLFLSPSLPLSLPPSLHPFLPFLSIYLPAFMSYFILVYPSYLLRRLRIKKNTKIQIKITASKLPTKESAMVTVLSSFPSFRDSLVPVMCPSVHDVVVDGLVMAVNGLAVAVGWPAVAVGWPAVARLTSRGRKLSSRGRKLSSRGRKLSSRGRKLTSRDRRFASRGRRLTSRSRRLLSSGSSRLTSWGGVDVTGCLPSSNSCYGCFGSNRVP